MTRGCDLFLTDLGDRYFVAIGSDRGYSAIQRVGALEVSERDSDDYLEARRRLAEIEQPEVPVHNLPTILDLEFSSDL